VRQPIPYLAALTADDDAGVAEKAVQSLEGIAAKDPSFVFQRAADGVPLAFKLRRMLATHSNSAGAAPMRPADRMRGGAWSSS
jgi:hypothetical protein